MRFWRHLWNILLLHLVLFVWFSMRRSERYVSASKKHRSKGIQWWNLATTPQLMSDDPVNPEISLFLTPPVHPLTRKQLKLITKNPGVIMAVARGARMAAEECQFQFRHRRWNCSVSESNHGGSIFGKILKKGCRETAFIYAITSAALQHAVARACSEGSIYTCSCGQQETAKHRIARSEWQWGGCSDNTEFGHSFAREFIDINEKERDLRCAINLHNNEAGRLHVTTEMRQECKCHGMSGSCAIKTCWMRLPPFRLVGDVLKDRFDGASKVDQGNDIRERNRLSLIPVDPNHRPPSQKDLVYYENSPSFCEADSAIGFKGIRGRACNATSIGVDGCDLMCCGRGFKTETFIARERCNCIFHWCCRVTCDTCTRNKVRHTCL